MVPLIFFEQKYPKFLPNFFSKKNGKMGKSSTSNSHISMEGSKKIFLGGKYFGKQLSILSTAIASSDPAIALPKTWYSLCGLDLATNGN